MNPNCKKQNKKKKAKEELRTGKEKNFPKNRRRKIRNVIIHRKGGRGGLCG